MIFSYLAFILVMIINNLDCIWPFVSPNEANAILIIYPDAMLSFPVASERLQSISRWSLQFRHGFN
jgi:hypothetical protein